MKTSVEISGYTISIEEKDGIISVNAVKEDEVVEEFTIEIEEAQGFESEEDFGGEESDEVRAFGEFGDEEEDFGGEESEESEEEGEESEEEGEESEEGEDEEDKAPEGALESFQSFINKKK